jgi:O-methyltransferase
MIRLARVTARRVRRILQRMLRTVYRRFYNELLERLDTVEYRSFNRRFYAIEQITEYLIGANVPGDYAEFGVYRGDTFAHAWKNMHRHFTDMRFFAFDSFQGLPRPMGIDADKGYSSAFEEGDFACSVEDFLQNLRDKKVETDKVVTVPGWFDRTLTPSLVTRLGINHIAATWIDCDLYESTVPVLEFITPFVSTGSVVVFDDWRCFRNLPSHGEQKACGEWLDRHPDLTLHHLLSFGWNGIVFTVEKKDQSLPIP